MPNMTVPPGARSSETFAERPSRESEPPREGRGIVGTILESLTAPALFDMLRSLSSGTAEIRESVERAAQSAARLQHEQFDALRRSVEPIIAQLDVVRGQLARVALAQQNVAITCDIFVSYSSTNEAEARTIESKASGHSLRVYLAAHQLKGGDHFEEMIRQTLAHSGELCLLLSPDSIRSSWVLMECGVAWGLSKRITPLLLGCQPEQLPDPLRGLHCMDYYDIQRYLEQAALRAVERAAKTSNDVALQGRQERI